jgi:Holliday junction DNA helicase RuvB
MRTEQANDIADAAPASLADLIGQRSVVDQVRVALDAARQDDKPFDHSLLVGGAGLGKTQTAKIIAAEMAGDFHEVLGQALESPSDLNALLLGAKDQDVVFIDEAALIPSEQQHALLIALDQRKLVLAGGKTGKSPMSIKLNNFTLLLATTDEYKLISPLIDRMRLVLRFQFYDVEDLAEITRQRCRALCWPTDDGVLPLIAQRSRGVPRLAIRLLQAARRVARSEGETRIVLDHLERACLLEGIDALGLGPNEQQYLRILAEGTNRLGVIATRIGLPARTVASVTEQFLIREGFIDKDESGKRFLTPKGREHLSQTRQLPVNLGATS